jgi:two-component system, cell cycle sensor histidine kinase and response regulator CckA
VRYLQTIKRPLVSPDGTVSQVLGISTDITARKRVEAERDAERQLLNALVEQLPVGVVVIDNGMRITRLNPRICAIFGIEPERLTGMNVSEAVALLKATLTDETPAQTADLATTKAVRTGRASEPIEELITTPAGERRRVLVSAAPVTLGGGETLGSVTVFTDVTEQYTVQEQLRQSQRIESIGMLAGGVAHDMNNLLTIITGYSELLLKRVRDDEWLSSKVWEIKKAGDRAAELTHQLLAFSRKQVLKPRVLDLNEVITDMDKMLRRLIGEDIDLKTVTAQSLWPVRADFGQIQQVVMNLAVNARDAMPEGGKLTIQTENVYLDDEYAARHVAVRPGRYVMIAVSDTGTGMDAETRARIFEPFFTTKEMGKGTGLGLSTVYGIVKQSGGSIWVYSEAGLGTTFKIYLPLAEGAAESPAAEEAPPATNRGAETLLLVEDEAAVRTFMSGVLEACGYTLLVAADGEEALRAARNHGGPIHLLVTDVVMPRMGGATLAQRLETLRPETRVLYISGYTDDALAHRGVIGTDVAFLEKPFTPDSLLRKIRETLDAPRKRRRPPGGAGSGGTRKPGRLVA